MVNRRFAIWWVSHSTVLKSPNCQFDFLFTEFIFGALLRNSQVEKISKILLLSCMHFPTHLTCEACSVTKGNKSGFAQIYVWQGKFVNERLDVPEGDFQCCVERSSCWLRPHPQWVCVRWGCTETLPSGGMTGGLRDPLVMRKASHRHWTDHCQWCNYDSHWRHNHPIHWLSLPSLV